MLVCGVYITWPKKFKLWKESTVLGSIVVVGVLTCVLLHSVCDFKAAQMNMKRILLWDCMFYEFKLGHYATEATKNICYTAKGECAVDYSIVTR